MFISEVSVVNFRNITRTKLTPINGVNYICGGNGHGKTNFVESLYILLNGKSYRRSHRDELINYSASAAQISVRIDNGETTTAKLILEKERRLSVVNEKNVRSIRRELGMKTVLFNADVLFYYKNFPAYRVRLADKLCAHIYGADFMMNYTKYRKAITYLRSLHGTQTRERNIWNEIFIKYSSVINEYRTKLFDTLKTDYEQLRDALELGPLVVRFSRKSRTDINFFRNDKRDLSLGELKSVLFSLFIAAIRKMSPGTVIMFIDDFSSEWDNHKQRKALDLLDDSPCQSFCMSTEKRESGHIFYMEKGAVRTA